MDGIIFYCDPRVLTETKRSSLKFPQQKLRSDFRPPLLLVPGAGGGGPIGENWTWHFQTASERSGLPCSAEVSSDRTNLSPFTKDYRGLALKCDYSVFGARERTHENKNISMPVERAKRLYCRDRVLGRIARHPGDIPVTRSSTSIPSGHS